MADYDASTPMSEKKDHPLTTATDVHQGNSTNPKYTPSGSDDGAGHLHTLSRGGDTNNHNHADGEAQVTTRPFEPKPSLLERLMGPTFAKYYGTTYFQVFLIGLIAFGCPGQFNALSGMGGGGQVEKGPSDKANITLYSTFAFVSFFAGSIHNKLGSRLTLWLGTIGYTVYVSSFLSYNFNKNEGFIIFAGALLGVCAALFWSAQGAMMMCYPTEDQKGKFIAIFWTVFNIGAVIGSAVAMGLSWHAEQGASLGNGTYGAFIAITFVAGCASILLKNPATLTRSDGTLVVVPKSTTWKVEIVGLYKMLKTDYWVIMLFPMFFASNFFYTWQGQDFNGHLFNLRTRALNSLLYWFAQIFGAHFTSLIVDNQRMKRKSRAWIGWCVTIIIVFTVWGGCYAMQKQYTRDYLPTRFAQGMDFTDGRPFVGPCFLYIFSGFMDAVWQCYTYWIMGSVSNDLSKLAVLAGFYKALQSVGAAVAFGLDLNLLPYMEILGVTWGICGLGLVCAAPVIALRIKEHSEQAAKVVAIDEKHTVVVEQQQNQS
ncbi:unnamed protein product [Sympodiomycopsis kandeliae]